MDSPYQPKVGAPIKAQVTSLCLMSAADGGYIVRDDCLASMTISGSRIMFAGSLQECLGYMRRQFAPDEVGPVPNLGLPSLDPVNVADLLRRDPGKIMAPATLSLENLIAAHRRRGRVVEITTYPDGSMLVRLMPTELGLKLTEFKPIDMDGAKRWLQDQLP